MEENYNEKGSSVFSRVLTFASIGAGVYVGYCHAAGIPIEKENLEEVLKYGPAIIRGGIGAVGGGLVGLTEGIETHIQYGLHKDGFLANMLGGLGILAETAVIGGISGSIEAVSAAIDTLLGYGIGYALGSVLK